MQRMPFLNMPQEEPVNPVSVFSCNTVYSLFIYMNVQDKWYSTQGCTWVNPTVLTSGLA
jgi:hypothetical protein